MTKLLSDDELCALAAKLAEQLEQRLNKHRHDSPLILETIGAAQSLAGLVDNALCEARLLDEESEQIAARETSNQAIR